jgi:predicted nucleotidyltransferase
MTPQERSESARRAVIARWAKAKGTHSTKPSHRQIDPETRRAVNRFLELIRPHFAIAKAILYGSRARGDHRPDSDADLAILLEGAPTSPFAVLSNMAPSATEVLLETGINIAPLPIWLGEWTHPEGQSNPRLFRNIVREGISV